MWISRKTLTRLAERSRKVEAENLDWPAMRLYYRGQADAYESLLTPSVILRHTRTS